MNILIIDANPLDRNRVCSLFLEVGLVPNCIHQADAIEEGFKIIEDKTIDMIFLELSLCDHNLLKMWEKRGQKNIKIVLLTPNNDSSNLKAPFTVLSKNARKNEVEEIMMDYHLEIASKLVNNQYEIAKPFHQITIKSNDETQVIAINDILRCKSDNNYTEIFLKNGEKIVSCKTLKTYEKILENFDFIRVHQSHLVAKQYIKKIRHTAGTQLLMNNGDVIAVSRRKKNILLKLMDASAD